MNMIVFMFRTMLHPFFKWVYTYEFENLDFRLQSVSLQMQIQMEKMAQQNKVLKQYKEQNKLLKELFQSYKYNYLSKTTGGEIVAISYSALGLTSADVCLSSLELEIGKRCCWMSTSAKENRAVLPLLRKAEVNGIESLFLTTICDIQCVNKNRGYGTVLLSFVLEEARQQCLKYIAGWLSPVDKERHEDLKRFYERLGFKVYLFADTEEGVVIKYLDDEEFVK